MGCRAEDACFKVYLPYPSEQVGKDGLLVPEQTLSRPSLRLTLRAGDVLYLPRGLVHEARTQQQASLHVTVAVPSFEAGLWAPKMATLGLEQVPSDHGGVATSDGR